MMAKRKYLGRDEFELVEEDACVAVESEESSTGGHHLALICVSPGWSITLHRQVFL
jgi:hypothetical protein